MLLSYRHTESRPKPSGPIGKGTEGIWGNLDTIDWDDRVLPRIIGLELASMGLCRCAIK